jgi:tetratricopeptide (TPR) repeat protein
MFNLKGIIAALSGFYATALDSFTRALDLSQDLDEADRKKIVLNRLAVLIKMGKWEEARDVLSTVEELGIRGSAMGALTLVKCMKVYNNEYDSSSVLVC